MTLPDRDGYESARMYTAERKAREAREATAGFARFAHEVYPDPVKTDHQNPDVAEHSGLAEQLAKYHGARAWAFHQASLEGHITAASVSLMVNEFHLARLYFLLCNRDAPVHHLDEIAAEIGTTMRWSPEAVHQQILEILEWAEIDPSTIRAYRA